MINFSEHFLSTRVKRQLIKIEKCSLIASLVWFICYTCLNVAYHSVRSLSPINGSENFDPLNFWITKPKDNATLLFLHIGTFSALICHLTDGVFVTSIVVYTVKKAFLDYLIKEKETIRELRIIWMEIGEVRDARESGLSMIPLFALTTLFIHTYAVVVLLGQLAGISTAANDVYWAFEIGIGILMLAMPYFIA